MRLASLTVDDRSFVGVVHDNGVTDITARQGIPSILEALERLHDLAQIAARSDFTLDDVRFQPVVPEPKRILCVGLNYRTHLIETGKETPARPMIFTRFASSQVGHLEPITRPRESEQLDFEGELAVVIGRSCRRVFRDAAEDVIAGYSIYNDSSIRDWQRHTSQFIPGKNFPNTGAFGPFLVTKDEMSNVAGATLTTRLNGIEMQRATIDDLLFDIPELIAYCSSFTPLEPGDVIVTGTTGGVGAARTPPLWMKPGDVVEVEVDGIGILSNPVIDEN